MQALIARREDVSAELVRREADRQASVTKSIDVAVPLTASYNQWTQFESFPKFMGGVESITQTDDADGIIEKAGALIGQDSR